MKELFNRKDKRKRRQYTAEDIIKKLQLKEHTAYLVDVSYSGGNPLHRAILFVGYTNGNYTELYTNNYDSSLGLWKVYFIRIVSELCDLKEPYKCTMPNEIRDAEPIGSDW